MTQWWGWGPGVPAGSKSRKSAWTIIPPNPDWSDDVVEDNLTEKDYSFMYAIATHEVYPGHHLQRLYQNENPRKLRVYEGSYSNQAWCYYIEWELTPNNGFYPPDKQDLYTLEMLRLKLWRMGRVIIDSGLHTGRLELRRGGDARVRADRLRPPGGQINIDSITEGGSGTAAATLGYFEWMLLREDYFKKMRELDQQGHAQGLPRPGLQDRLPAGHARAGSAVPSARGAVPAEAVDPDRAVTGREANDTPPVRHDRAGGVFCCWRFLVLSPSFLVRGWFLVLGATSGKGC